jgi:signal transduction histidine kinase
MSTLSARLIGLFVILSLLVAGVIVLAVLQFSAEQVMHLLVQGAGTAEQARAMFDQYVVQVMLIGAVAGIVLGGLAAWWLVRRLMRPLEQLTDASQSIAVGDLAARVPEPPDPELRRLARSFNRMAATLERTEELRRAMVEDVAHELRTPLTSLRGYTEALADGVAEPTPDMMRTVHDEIERLTRLVEALDQLARGDEGGRLAAQGDVDIASIVRRSLQLASPALMQRQIAVEVLEPPVLPHVRGDADAIGQVVANLVQNAERYTDDGGRITVRLAASSGSLRCGVENTGAEIPPDEVDLIWERLHRIDRSRARASGGAGIGLAIVRQIITAHRGQVGATSAHGRTEIWFSLPIAHPAG